MCQSILATAGAQASSSEECGDVDLGEEDDKSNDEEIVKEQI